MGSGSGTRWEAGSTVCLTPLVLVLWFSLAHLVDTIANTRPHPNAAAPPPAHPCLLQGFWKDHLQGKPYHISALYVIDLERFRWSGWGGPPSGSTAVCVRVPLQRTPPTPRPLSPDCPPRPPGSSSPTR